MIFKLKTGLNLNKKIIPEKGLFIINPIIFIIGFFFFYYFILRMRMRIILIQAPILSHKIGLGQGVVQIYNKNKFVAHIAEIL